MDCCLRIGFRNECGVYQVSKHCWNAVHGRYCCRGDCDYDGENAEGGWRAEWNGSNHRIDERNQPDYGVDGDCLDIAFGKEPGDHMILTTLSPVEEV